MDDGSYPIAIAKGVRANAKVVRLKGYSYMMGIKPHRQLPKAA